MRNSNCKARCWARCVVVFLSSFFFAIIIVAVLMCTRKQTALSWVVFISEEPFIFARSSRLCERRALISTAKSRFVIRSPFLLFMFNQITMLPFVVFWFARMQASLEALLSTRVELEKQLDEVTIVLLLLFGLFSLSCRSVGPAIEAFPELP